MNTIPWQKPAVRSSSASLARITVSPLRVAFLVFLFLLHSGLITLFSLGNAIIGPQIAAGLIIFGSLLLSLPIFRKNGFKLTRISDVFPIIMFTTFFAVSYYSNAHIYRYGTNNWITYSYTMVPILLYYLLWALSFSFADILYSIAISGFIASTLVAIDSVVNIQLLEYYQRYTNLSGVRRIAILKNECVLSFLLIFSHIYGDRKLFERAAKFIIPMAIMGYVIIFRFESRMALAATVISILVFLMSRRVTSLQQIVFLTFGLIFSLPILYFIFEQYISPILEVGLEKYVIENNVQRRLDAADFFYRHFQETSGLGFGMMTLNLESNNFQAQAVDSDYFILSDMGIMGSLYQYGYFGLVLVVIATLVMAVNFARVGWSDHPLAAYSLIIACFILAFCLQPIPMNFFTLNWTVFLGSCLWYAMRRSAWERLALERRPH